MADREADLKARLWEDDEFVAAAAAFHNLFSQTDTRTLRTAVDAPDADIPGIAKTLGIPHDELERLAGIVRHKADVLKDEFPVELKHSRAPWRRPE